jgi:hypothetical protein
MNDKEIKVAKDLTLEQIKYAYSNLDKEDRLEVIEENTNGFTPSDLIDILGLDDYDLLEQIKDSIALEEYVHDINEPPDYD